MNKIEKLLNELCPNGVEFKSLGEVGIFFNGLSGKKKDDFKNGNAKYITYLNVFNNIATDLKKAEFVQVSHDEKQNMLKKGDVLFTLSSESLEECGMSSVVVDNMLESIYLNSFCFGFRFNDNSLMLPDFSKYLFRDERIRTQIYKTANGVTRFNISRTKFEKIQIPIPPIEIQEEIVKILDTFTELEAELEARRRQYEYYRNKLLSFEYLKTNGGGMS
ncbi:restriction endonuclease subunit S [Campylobacter jejuni]|nr:restriction endonuclease subunit S [Campylobacter jejuni]